MQVKIDEAVKLLDQYAWAVWLVTGIVLFVPPAWLAPLGMGPLVAQIRPYIGAFFLVATVLVLGRYGKIGRDWAMREVTRRKQGARRQERLHHLTAAEQVVLRPFIGFQTRTQYLEWDNGIVIGLQKEQIIDNVAPYAREGLPCSFNMRDWAYTYLTVHPELLGLDMLAESPATDNEAAG